MRIVVDANILIAALLKPDGWTARELLRPDLELVAPDRLIEEIRSPTGHFLATVQTSYTTWGNRISRALESIRIVPLRRYVPFIDHDLVRFVSSTDADDAPYVACLLSEAADFLWTFDHHLLSLGDSRLVAQLPRPPPAPKKH